MSKPTSAEKSVIAKLQAAERKRMQRYANKRCVYAYRVKGQKVITDNLLLLPYADRLGHKQYIERVLAALDEDLHSRFSTIEIIHIGFFDVSTLKFDKCVERFILSCDDFFKQLKEIKQ